MKLYTFKERTGERQAITFDKAGDNLPAGWWDYIDAVEVTEVGLSAIGHDRLEMSNALHRDGIFVWNIEVVSVVL